MDNIFIVLNIPNNLKGYVCIKYERDCVHIHGIFKKLTSLFLHLIYEFIQIY